MQRRLVHTLAALLLVASIGSGNVESAQTSRRVAPKAFQVGLASWYGEHYDGKTTASGEPFDMYDCTAAHATLRLGTFVRVTNLNNGRTVLVRINDRGPFVGSRIIDVSYNAARVLDFVKEGVQRVRVDLEEHPAANPLTHNCW